MRNRRRACNKNEKGAVAITIAIIMTALLGFTALVVDVGYLYEIRHQLQAAADAGALAGCQEMVLQAKDPDVVALSEAVARDYAVNKNLAAEATPTVDIADQSVTVMTSRTVDLFFANIFGVSNRAVSALAKAEVAYLVGVRDLDPMGVPNPKPKEVKVEVVNQASGQVIGPYTLGGANFIDDIFEYSGSIPVPGVGNYRIDVIRVNNQGLEERIQGATALVVGSGTPVGEVTVEPNFVFAGTGTSVTITAKVFGNPGTIEACWPRPNGNGQYTVTLQNIGGDTYRATTTVNLPVGYPSGADGYGAYPITVKVDGTEYPSGGACAYIVTRDASVEVNDVDLGVNYVAAGTLSAIPINVKVQGFEYEKLYTLFLDNGTTSGGNYYGLDLDYREFAPGGGEPDLPDGGNPNGAAGNAFSDGLAALLHADPWAPTHPYHYYRVGDYVWTKTGGMVGLLKSGIDTRIGSDSCTWDMWKNNTTPHENRNQCPRLMTTPLVEESTYPTPGRSKVRIVGFAQFFIEQPPGGGDLKGRFVEYVKGGVYSKVPPPDPNIKTIHLVKPDGEN